MTHTSDLRYKAILFDLDATLANSRDIYEQAFVQTFRDSLGIELDENERKQYMGYPTIDFLRKYVKGDQLHIVKNRLAEHIKRLMPQLQLFAGLEEVLPELHQAGLLLGVVTSQNRYECDLTRESLDIDPWIRVWITIDDVKQVKPDPEPVQAALQVLRVYANQAVMVGDSIFDLQAGRAAGTHVAVAAWGADHMDLLLALDPDYVFKTPYDLRVLLTDQSVEKQAGKP